MLSHGQPVLFCHSPYFLCTILLSHCTHPLYCVTGLLPPHIHSKCLHAVLHVYERKSKFCLSTVEIKLLKCKVHLRAEIKLNRPTHPDDPTGKAFFSGHQLLTILCHTHCRFALAVPQRSSLLLSVTCLLFSATVTKDCPMGQVKG